MMSGAFDAPAVEEPEVVHATGSPTLSGAFDAAGATTTAETLETMSGAFDARGEDVKVVQAALWPSSSQWRRWQTAPQ